KISWVGFSSNFLAHKVRSSKQTDDSLRERARSKTKNCRKNAPNNFASGSIDMDKQNVIGSKKLRVALSRFLCNA
ncbi:MAG: hypothetical protein KDK72_08590, partial [Chlamydiia bacterium]|nr:hypothetical protein [Chlamydiia bacterium]